MHSIHQVLKAMHVVPCLDKHDFLEQLSTDLSRFGSFRKTMHASFKIAKLEHGDSGYWEAPPPHVTTTCEIVSKGPPCENKIQWKTSEEERK